LAAATSSFFQRNDFLIARINFGLLQNLIGQSLKVHVVLFRGIAHASLPEYQWVSGLHIGCDGAKIKPETCLTKI
jgi:hypothetical protein